MFFSIQHNLPVDVRSNMNVTVVTTMEMYGIQFIQFLRGITTDFQYTSTKLNNMLSPILIYAFCRKRLRMKHI